MCEGVSVSDEMCNGDTIAPLAPPTSYENDTLM